MSDNEYVSDDEVSIVGGNAEESEPESDAEIADDIEQQQQLMEYVEITGDDRQTSNRLSMFEITELVSIRATQISQHNNCMVPTPGITDPIEMARIEIKNKMCPLYLSRQVGVVDGVPHFEQWNVNEMQIPNRF